MTTAVRPDRSLVRARLAVFSQFAVNGCAVALWVAYVPVIKRTLGMDDRALGFTLLAFSIGAVAAMQAVPWLTRRVGGRNAVLVTAGLLCLTLPLPGLAGSSHGSPVWLAGALVLFGAGIGTLDVTMNAEAAEVERRYGRAIMAAFHAFWSMANIVGVGLGALAIKLGWSSARTLPVAAVLLAVLALTTGRWLPSVRPSVEDRAAASARPRSRLPVSVWVLGVLALSSFVFEGAVADWAGVHLRDTLDVSAAVAALAYGAYSTSMTACRLVVDRVVVRVGPYRLLRYGGALAAVGVVGVVLAPVWQLAVACWVLVGIGLSGVVPQLFTAAANHPGADGSAALARVSSMGYAGSLFGPAVIGLLAHAVDLDKALLALAVLGAGISIGAGAVRSRAAAGR